MLAAFLGNISRRHSVPSALAHHLLYESCHQNPPTLTIPCPQNGTSHAVPRQTPELKRAPSVCMNVQARLGPWPCMAPSPRCVCSPPNYRTVMASLCSTTTTHVGTLSLVVFVKGGLREGSEVHAGAPLPHLHLCGRHACGVRGSMKAAARNERVETGTAANTQYRPWRGCLHW